MLGDTISIVWLLGSLASLIFVIRPARSWPPVSHRWRAAIWLLVFFSLPFDWTMVDPAGRQAWADAVEARHHRQAPQQQAATASTSVASSDDCPAADPGDDYMHQHLPGTLQQARGVRSGT